MYAVRVTITNRQDQILYFPRIPVKGDLIILQNGMHKVVWTRLYTFSLEDTKCVGVVANIKVEEE